MLLLKLSLTIIKKIDHQLCNGIIAVLQFIFLKDIPSYVEGFNLNLPDNGLVFEPNCEKLREKF